MSLTPLFEAPADAKAEHLALHLRQAGAEAGHKETGRRLCFDLAAVERGDPDAALACQNDQRIGGAGVTAQTVHAGDQNLLYLAAVDQGQQLVHALALVTKTAFGVANDTVYSGRLNTSYLRLKC